MHETTNEERLAVLARIHEVGISPGRGLSDMTDDVRAFHLLFGHPAPLKPEMQSVVLVERRAGWIRSECTELEEAKTLEGQADAYIDIIYFAVGGLVELGLKFTHRLWRLVQGANLAKVWPDGSVRKNAVGKVTKPDGWVAPDDAIAAAIAEELHGTVAPDAQGTAIAAVGNAAVERLTLAFGGHVNVLLFCINEDGYVASTSNMDMADQRDFLRYLTQSLAAGSVTIDNAPSTETKQ